MNKAWAVRIVAAITLSLLTVGAMAAPAPSIRLGGTLAVTGPFAAEWGPVYQQFMREWVRAINEDGGIMVRELGRRLPVEMVLYDDESSADKAVELYERLAAVDNVLMFFGPATSPITLRASTVAERLRIPMVAMEANDRAIFARNFRYLFGTLAPGLWWTRSYFELVGQSVSAGTPVRTVAFVYEDSAHTRDVTAGAVAYAREAGLRIVDQQIVPFGHSDFSAVLARWRALNPDVMFLGLWTAPSIAFLRQARELGLRPKETYVRALAFPFVQAVGGTAEDVVGATYTARRALDERSRRIFQRMGRDPYDLPWVANRIVALDVIRAAIERTGRLDREAIAQTMRDPQFEVRTVIGAFRFSWNLTVAGQVLNGHGNQTAYVAQIQDGKVNVVWPRELADTAYRRPR
ncbi:MAG: amino acid ABC transporter substrate-binding protein [Armatimonadota bacterium]|nr:amino acid ABC transporter substrate-binding protein [Armatimonadota bacterium]MDR5698077.1 amino acid ABC transporter substrate-binding protein [Armatimonadota bacterium]